MSSINIFLLFLTEECKMRILPLILVIIAVIFVVVGIFLFMYPFTVCNTSSDCNLGWVCVDGKCVECTTSQNCSSSKVCYDQHCVDCVTDKDCKQGKCNSMNECVECIDNKDCRPGLVCVDGKCVECSSNSDCKQGLCISGKCGCLSNSDCKQGICINNECMSKACKVVSDCGDGEICSNGICISQECTSDNEHIGKCVNGKYNQCEFCNKGTYYYPCVNGACEGCTTDNDCGSGGCYKPLPSVPGVCCNKDSFYQKSCTNSNDCGGSNPFCVGGSCTCKQGELWWLCTTNKDCKDGLQCVSYTGNNYCLPSSECSSTEKCVLGSQCKEGWCSFGCCNQTTSVGMYCGSILPNNRTECSNTPAPFCVNNLCNYTPAKWGEGCTIDDDCSGGLTCVNGVCTIDTGSNIANMIN